MPKGTPQPIRPRKEPIVDHLIMASVEGGMDPATGKHRELVYGGIDSQERAQEIKRALYRCARYLKYSLTASVEKTGEGHQIRYTVIDKEVGRRYIREKYQGREHEMPYNPFARNPAQEVEE